MNYRPTTCMYNHEDQVESRKEPNYKLVTWTPAVRAGPVTQSEFSSGVGTSADLLTLNPSTYKRAWHTKVF